MLAASFLCRVACGAAHARSIQVLDPLLVQADRPASSAVLALNLPSHPASATCEILVAGASTGGVAAALAAAEGGHTVCLTEETKWIGGQLTAQGVSALDGNAYVETTGVTASFQRLRHAIRAWYKTHDQLSSLGAGERFFNPGNCWVSALCFQAPVALKVIEAMLRPLQEKGLLKIFLRTKIVQVERRGNRIDSALGYEFDKRQWVVFKPRCVIDATDTGELLPLGDAEYVTGAEPRSRTGEPDARPGVGDPRDSQSFTYTFVLARDPGRNHVIARPVEYEMHVLAQPYTMTLNYGDGKLLTYRVFQKAPGTPGSFWDYRRLIDPANFSGAGAPREISMVNWPGNDYCGPGLLSNDPLEQAQALLAAKQVALGFAYWLQTAVPRDGGKGMGYPGLELVTSALGSEDGLSQFPYIRESRRIAALRTIREQDISSAYQKGPRAAPFADSAGIGLYPIDIHGCSAEDFASGAKPFQIPLGALIPKDVVNLLAASKDIGTTHITNGAYRLHPVEWAIGEAAGTLAAFALDHGTEPAKIDSNPHLVAELQRKLLARGAPLFWFDDLLPNNPAFKAAQLLAVRGIFGPNDRNLHFGPQRPVSGAEAIEALARAVRHGPSSEPLALDGAAARLINAGYLAGDITRPGWQSQPVRWRDLRKTTHPGPPNSIVTRAEFAIWLDAQLSN